MKGPEETRSYQQLTEGSSFMLHSASSKRCGDKACGTSSATAGTGAVGMYHVQPREMRAQEDRRTARPRRKGMRVEADVGSATVASEDAACAGRGVHTFNEAE